MIYIYVRLDLHKINYIVVRYYLSIKTASDEILSSRFYLIYNLNITWNLRIKIKFINNCCKQQKRMKKLYK